VNVIEVIEASGAGVGRHVRTLSADLMSEGHRVTVAYSHHRLDEAFQRFVAEQRDQIRFVQLDIRREPFSLSDVRSLFRLVRLIRKAGPFDVIHGHSSKGGALARIAGRLCGIPTVYTPHSLILSSPEVSRAEYLVYLWAERVLGHLATSKLVAVSKGERALAIHLKLTASERIVVINNGLADEDFVYPSEMAGEENVYQKPLTFGSVMRFTHQKAPAHLVEAFIRVRRALPDIPMRLKIAGDGQLWWDVKRQVERSGFEEEISLLGWVTDVKSVLQELDVFVLSSLYEGFSYGILESMAAGLPVVCTDVFGAEETLAHVPGNLVVTAEDPEALAHGMRRMAILAKPELLRRSLQEIGLANRQYAWVHFREREVTRRTVELYRSLAR